MHIECLYYVIMIIILWLYIIYIIKLLLIITIIILLQRIDSYDMKNVDSIQEIISKFNQSNYCRDISKKSQEKQQLKKKKMEDDLKLSEKELRKIKITELVEIIDYYQFSSQGLLEKADSIQSILIGKKDLSTNTSRKNKVEL